VFDDEIGTRLVELLPDDRRSELEPKLAVLVFLLQI
jgi:hypothetical protein